MLLPVFRLSGRQDTLQARNKLVRCKQTLQSVQNVIEPTYNTFLKEFKDIFEQMCNLVFDSSDISVWLRSNDLLDSLIDRMKTLSIDIQLPIVNCPLAVAQYFRAEQQLLGVAFKLTMAVMAEQKIILLHNVDRLSAEQMSNIIFILDRSIVDQLFIQTKDNNIYRKSNALIGLMSDVSIFGLSFFCVGG